MSYLFHPPLIRPILSKERKNSFEVRIEEKTFKITEYFSSGAITEKNYALPIKIKYFPWEYCLSFPITVEQKCYIVFRSRDYHFTWNLEQETPSPWYEAKIWIKPNIILASLPNNPYPHKLFFQELLTLENNFTAGKLPSEKQNPWPCGFHQAWLEILTKTDAKETQSFIPEKWVLWISEEAEPINNTIKKLQRGAIISMALHCKEELQLAKTLLTKNEKPKDNTWVLS